MTTVLLVIHLMIAAGLVAVVLLQRSEGGALGIGGGGGGGGFLTGRGTANFLTRLTAGLAAAFFITSIVLTLLANHPDRPKSIFDAPVQKGQPAVPKADAPPADDKTGSGLPKLNIDQTPRAPKSQ